MKVEARGQRTSWSAQARLTQNRPHGRSYLWVNLKIKCVGRGGSGAMPTSRRHRMDMVGHNVIWPSLTLDICRSYNAWLPTIISTIKNVLAYNNSYNMPSFKI